MLALSLRKARLQRWFRRGLQRQRLDSESFLQSAPCAPGGEVSGEVHGAAAGHILPGLGPSLPKPRARLESGLSTKEGVSEADSGALSAMGEGQGMRWASHLGTQSPGLARCRELRSTQSFLPGVRKHRVARREEVDRNGRVQNRVSPEALPHLPPPLSRCHTHPAVPRRPEALFPLPVVPSLPHVPW